MSSMCTTSPRSVVRSGDTSCWLPGGRRTARVSASSCAALPDVGASCAHCGHACRSPPTRPSTIDAVAAGRTGAVRVRVRTGDGGVALRRRDVVGARGRRLDSFALHPGTHALHYGSACFEGLKAHRYPDGRVVTFRADAPRRPAAPEHGPPVPAGAVGVARRRPDRHDGRRQRGRRPVAAGVAVPAPDRARHGRHDRRRRRRRARPPIFYVLACPVGDYLPPRPLTVAVETIDAAHDTAVRRRQGRRQLRHGADADHGRPRAVRRRPGAVRAGRAAARRPGRRTSCCIDGEHLLTPALTEAYLHGITRDSLLRLARHLGWSVEEREVTVDECVDVDRPPPRRAGAQRHGRRRGAGRHARRRRPAAARRDAGRAGRARPSCAPPSSTSRPGAPRSTGDAPAVGSYGGRRGTGSPSTHEPDLSISREGYGGDRRDHAARPTTSSTSTLIGDIADALEELAAGDCRAVVLASEGKHFCAGADFGSRRPAARRRRASRTSTTRRSACSRSRCRSWPPSRARRSAAGSAWPWPPTSASPRRRPASPPTSPGSASTTASACSVTLPRVVGAQRAAELLYTGARIDGEEALRIGLCDRLVPGRRAARGGRRVRRRDRHVGTAGRALDPRDAARPRSSTRSAPPRRERAEQERLQRDRRLEGGRRRRRRPARRRTSPADERSAGRPARWPGSASSSWRR